VPPQLLEGREMQNFTSDRVRGGRWRRLMACGLVAAGLLGGVLPAAAERAPWKWAFSLRGGEKVPVPLAPTAVYVDQARERYYLVDSGGNRIFSYDRAGNFLKLFDAEGALAAPFDMVRLGSGTLLLVEKGANSVTRIDLKARRTERKSLRFQGREIFVDRMESAGDDLYVLDRASGDVFRLSRDLEVVGRHVSPTGSRGIVDFRVDDRGLWLLDSMGRRLYRVDGGGTLAASIELGESVQFPVSFDRDDSGNFYVLDRHAGTVVVYDASGRERYRFLTKGHNQGRLYFPMEVRFDPWGRLWVVDEGNGRVEFFER